jgi:hypothetical protein
MVPVLMVVSNRFVGTCTGTSTSTSDTTRTFFLQKVHDLDFLGTKYYAPVSGINITENFLLKYDLIFMNKKKFETGGEIDSRQRPPYTVYSLW